MTIPTSAATVALASHHVDAHREHHLSSLYSNEPKRPRVTRFQLADVESFLNMSKQSKLTLRDGFEKQGLPPNLVTIVF